MSSKPALIFLLLTICVAGLCGCGTIKTSQRRHTTASTLPSAADATDRQPGYTFTLTAVVDAAGQHAQLNAVGSFDARTHVGVFTESFDGGHFRVVSRAPYLYARLPEPTPVTHGKVWMRLNESAIDPSIVPGATTAPADPAQALGFIRAAGHVRVVGEATVGGHATTLYHAVVDLNRLAAIAPSANRAAVTRRVRLLTRLTGSTTFPIDVWVDRDGLVRQLRFAFRLCTLPGPTRITATIDLLRFGPGPVVRVPAPSEVVDLTSEVQARQAQAASQLGC
jgi:hypothetical protein